MIFKDQWNCLRNVTKTIDGVIRCWEAAQQSTAVYESENHPPDFIF